MIKEWLAGILPYLQPVHILILACTLLVCGTAYRITRVMQDCECKCQCDKCPCDGKDDKEKPK